MIDNDIVCCLLLQNEIKQCLVHVAEVCLISYQDECDAHWPHDDIADEVEDLVAVDAFFGVEGVSDHSCFYKISKN